MNTKTIGSFYEDKALVYLLKQGLILLKRNFHSSYGEIDLIFSHHQNIIFVEVRSRQHNQYGSALSSINFLKQKKIKKTAVYFVRKNPQYQYFYWRFDIVTFDQEKIKWHQAVFNE